jgi:hypothetical protein
MASMFFGQHGELEVHGKSKRRSFDSVCRKNAADSAQDDNSILAQTSE